MKRKQGNEIESFGRLYSSGNCIRGYWVDLYQVTPNGMKVRPDVQVRWSSASFKMPTTRLASYNFVFPRYVSSAFSVWSITRNLIDLAIAPSGRIVLGGLHPPCPCRAATSNSVPQNPARVIFGLSNARTAYTRQAYNGPLKLPI